MSLSVLEFDYEIGAVPPPVRAYLDYVEPYIERHRVDVAKHFRGFVPCDYEAAYHCLRALSDSYLLCGNRFCEWGSGLGVVASLASFVGFESYGIERDVEVATAGEAICRQRQLKVTLATGSFIPANAESIVDDAYMANDGDIASFTEADDAYEVLGADVDSFDLVFAFPWPNDVDLIQGLFEHFAATGSVLMTYNDRDRFQLYRKD